MHGVNIEDGAVGNNVGVVAVRPDGGNGGVAALSDNAPKRPGVDEIAPEDDILHDHVGAIARKLRSGFFGRPGYSGVGRRAHGLQRKRRAVRRLSRQREARTGRREGEGRQRKLSELQRYPSMRPNKERERNDTHSWKFMPVTIFVMDLN